MNGSLTLIFSAATAKPQNPVKRKKSVPLSLRLTVEQRAQLEKEAQGLALSTYVKNCLFSGSVPRKTAKKADYDAYARILGKMAELNLFADVKALLHASNTGTLHLKPETEQALVGTCASIMAMRCDLITALGVKAR